MPLYTLKKLLADAERREYAIPSVSVYNIMTALNVLEAAQRARAPVIVQMYTRSFETIIGHATFQGVRSIADTIEIPFALHLDHGANRDMVCRALRAGATSVMIDASTLPDDENIAATRDVCELCAAIGVSVEGEIGHVGSAAVENSGSAYTEPEAALRFARETGVDALAVMVGTAHGIYKKLPVLDIARLAEIKKLTQVPLVLHGGSGVPDDQIAAAVRAGVRKVNYATELNLRFYEKILSFPRDDRIWTRPMDIFMREPLKCSADFLVNRFELLGSAGKAEGFR